MEALKTGKLTWPFHFQIPVAVAEVHSHVRPEASQPRCRQLRPDLPCSSGQDSSEGA